jgi:TolA-binding protein
MAAFAMGSYAEADERFTEFVGRFPGDSRCEDAAFLRTVIALRRGDSAAAVARARGYLRRFPNGFRRDEIEQMIAAAGEGTPARQRR